MLKLRVGALQFLNGRCRHLLSLVRLGGNHPKGKTVDICPDCITRGMWDAVERLEQHMKESTEVLPGRVN